MTNGETAVNVPTFRTSVATVSTPRLKLNENIATERRVAQSPARGERHKTGSYLEQRAGEDKLDTAKTAECR